jgi:hypothetical protein
MSEQSTQRPPRIAALVSLVDHLLADPLTAHLAHGGIWQADSASVSLINHVEHDDPQGTLHAVEAALGAEFVPGRQYREDLIEYQIKGMWDGIPAHMHLVAPGVPVEEQLRRRVAELEAALAEKPVRA